MFILKVTDGVETVDFLSSDFQLEDGGLEMEVPEQRTVWGGGSAYAHGSRLLLSAFENRMITVTFTVRGATRDALLANVAKLDRLLEAARRRSMEETGNRVQMVYAWDGTSQTAYYEVVNGRIQWPEDLMSAAQVLQRDQDNKYVIHGLVANITALPFAYPIAPTNGAPTNITISNGNGTGTAVVVNNCGDATHDNYVEVDASLLTGSFPLTTVLTLEANSGESEKTSKVYIGVRKSGAGFKAFLEDNEAAYKIGSATPTADPDYSSGGTYTNLVYEVVDPGDGSPISDVVLASWNLTAAEVEASQGPFRIFGRTKDNTFWDPACNYALAVTYNTTILSQTEWRSPLNTTTTLFDFGTVFLPPWLGSLPSLDGLTIEVKARRKTYGTTTIALDYMALMPQDGGYRVLQFRGGGMSLGEKVVDDGWNRTVYHETTAGKRTGLPFGLMSPIELQPGATQQLYFLFEGTAGSTEISRRLKVSIAVVPTYMVLA